MNKIISGHFKEYIVTRLTTTGWKLAKIFFYPLIGLD